MHVQEISCMHRRYLACTGDIMHAQEISCMHRRYHACTGDIMHAQEISCMHRRYHACTGDIMHAQEISYMNILEKWFPLQGERAHSSYFRCFQKQNREEGETE